VSTWEVPQAFDEWVKRMATPPERVAVLRSLFDTASLEIRQAFMPDDNHHFTMTGALFEVKASHGG
jgi:hypothetical protein